MLTIMTGSPQFSKVGIKYLTIFDSSFHPSYYNGSLFFYNKSSLHVVTVEITKDRDKLNEEDIIIYIGEHHNSQDTEKIARSKTDLIYEMSKMTCEPIFVLNLDDLSVVTRADFISHRPDSGLNSLFVFENLTESNLIYCIQNRGTGNISDRDCFVWLLSYIYSGLTCLTPDIENCDYGKQFMQAISEYYFYSTNNDNNIHVTNSYPILKIALPDVGKKEFKIQLKQERLDELVQKSVYQYVPTTKGKIL